MSKKMDASGIQINITDKEKEQRKSKIVKVTKLREADNPYHPNNIMIGKEYRGTLINPPTVGQSMILGALSRHEGENGFYTSIIQEIIDENTFRTMNSIYQWEYIN